MTKIKIPRLAYNWISALGMALALISALTLVLLLAASLFIETGSNPYFGIFLYMVLPGIMIFGLLIVPLGMWRTARSWKREGAPQAARFPVLDLNNAKHRNAVLIFSISTLVFLVLSAMGSYGAYHHSESVEFCGVTCHDVMEPEYTTYQNSPHARVACAQCHVGAGAGWYVKSKLSGAYQIYSVAANKYPRPIPTPIHSLRPAQETCEQCHWPEHIYGAVTRQFNHYMYDEANTHWPVNMLIKVGGGDPATGQAAGIHWHMNIGVLVEYIARDEERQEIPWIRVTDRKTGRVTVYKDSEDPITDAEVAAATPRRDGLHGLPQPAEPHLPLAGGGDQRGDADARDRRRDPRHQGRGGRGDGRGVRDQGRGDAADRQPDHRRLSQGPPRGLRQVPGGDRPRGPRHPERLQPEHLPGDEGELGGLPGQHRPLHQPRLHALPRRQPRLG